MSAKVAEEAGFKGIWGSGLSISAALGVRDNNEASWTQVLEVLEFMSDATRVPILLDGDTGYGNFNSMRRLVRKLEQREVAGVCIEDKLFPKTNSFIKGSAQPLADIDEFAGKIKAGKDAQKDDAFVIVARVEAFIAGWGLAEALKRAEAYRQAGADAILMHSALRNPSEVLAFQKEWGNRLPVIIVPTKYYSTPTEVFRDAGFSMVIWANHLMRASIAAMQGTAERIFKDQNLLEVEDRVAPVKEVFRIQGAEELSEAEKLYLPVNRGNTSAVILAASRGEELGEMTAEKPKCMVEIAGKPLLQHIADNYRECDVKDLIVVRGYKKEAVDLTSIRYVDNENYKNTQEVASLKMALPQVEGAAVVSYGDVLFKKHILNELIDSDADMTIMVDANWRESRNRGRLADYVLCSEPVSKRSIYNKIALKGVVNDPENGEIHGEWMGFLGLSKKGVNDLRELLDQLEADDPQSFSKLKVPEVLNALVRQGKEVRVIYTAGHWLDVDHVDDVLKGSSF